MIGVDEQMDNGETQEDFSSGIVALEKTFEEAVTIRRFSSQSNTPTEFGTAPAPVYTSFPATAVLVDLGIRASLFEAGVLSAGDIVIQIRERLRESDEAAGGSNPGDRLIYRGAEYRLVQRPIPVNLMGVVFYECYLRRTNTSGDTAGL